MLADVDYDIAVHLGSAKNIDLAQRGVYAIKISLWYGNSRINPVGMFSAASTLDTFVGSQKIPPAPLVDRCQVSDDDLSFTCRSFVIRYRDELFELNDAVHFKLTETEVNMANLGCVEPTASKRASVPGEGRHLQKGGALTMPYCGQLLKLEMQLLHAPFKQFQKPKPKQKSKQSGGGAESDEQEEDESSSKPVPDMLFEVDKYLPDSPIQYTVVSRQILCLQHARCGFHEYYPLRFRRPYTIDVDCFLHAGVTAVRYRDIKVSRIAFLPPLDMDDIEEDAPINAADGSARELPTATDGDGGPLTRDKVAATKKPDNMATWYDCINVDTMDLSNMVTTATTNVYSDILRQHQDLRSAVAATPFGKPQAGVSVAGKAATEIGAAVGCSALLFQTLQFGGANLLDNYVDSSAANNSKEVRRQLNFHNGDSADTAGSNGSSQHSTESNRSRHTAPSTSVLAVPTVSEEAANGRRRSSVAQAASKTANKMMDVASQWKEKSVNSVKQAMQLTSKSPSPVPSASSSQPSTAAQNRSNHGTLAGGDPSSVGEPAEDAAVIIEDAGVESDSTADINGLDTIATLDSDTNTSHRNEKDMQATTQAVNRVYHSPITKQPAHVTTYRYDHASGISGARTPQDNGDLRQLKLLVTSAKKRVERMAASGLDKQQIVALYDEHVLPLVTSFDVMNASTEIILQSVNDSSNAKGPAIARTESRSGRCHLRDSRETILDELYSLDSIVEMKHSLKRHIQQYNSECSGRWNALFKSLPMLLKLLHRTHARRHSEEWDQAGRVIEVLREEQCHRMRCFWKRQMLVSSCSPSAVAKKSPVPIQQVDGSSAKSPPPTGQLVDYGPLLVALLQFENKVLLGTSRRNAIDAEDIATRMCGVRFYARGLPVFDAAVHLHTCKLPLFSMETYGPGAPVRSSQVIPSSAISAGMITGSSDQRQQMPSRGGLYGHHCDHDVDASLPPFDAQFYAASGTTLQSRPQPVKITTNMLLLKPLGLLPSLRGVCTILEKQIANTPSVLRAHSLDDNDRSVHQLHHHRDNSSPSCSPSSKAIAPDIHLIVMQHGFQGTGYDMNLMRNIMVMDYPSNVKVFIATSNAGPKSGDSVAVMGQRLAEEVVAHCTVEYPWLLNMKYVGAGRVSFIGHSIGGVIVRRCLEEPCMAPLLRRLHVYMSLASPHLGALYAESQLVSTGMWAMLKISNSQALKELRLEDSDGGTNLENTMVYKLSENGVLQHFKRVILVSSPQDTYVPNYSARIQSSAKAEVNAKIGPVIMQMTANLLSQIDSDKLVRISLDDNVGELGIMGAASGAATTSATASSTASGGVGAGGVAPANVNNKSMSATAAMSVDSLIGRTAHISYVDYQIVAEQLMYIVYCYFV